ncbi:MAG: hypothetical protein M0R80_04600 [Proteobacteria bacterium]|jgi:hypothetical protein|nr:hypothetical protein [Pseudomonadota bacterium]
MIVFSSGGPVWRRPAARLDVEREKLAPVGAFLKEHCGAEPISYRRAAPV